MGTRFALLVQDWSAAGHKLESHWLDVAREFGPWALGLVVAFAIGRSLLRHGRYRAVDVLGESEQKKLAEAVQRAEVSTTGEIVLVIVEEADPHPQAQLKAAIFGLGVGTLLLGGILPWGQPSLFLACQLLMGVVGFLLARFLPDFARLFVTEASATAAAEEQALQEFQRFDLAQTSERTGVLLFVTLFEHRVVVLADEGIHACVSEGTWREVDELVLSGLRRGSLEGGLAAGIERAGVILTEHFPRDGEGPNQLPDEITVRRR